MPSVQVTDLLYQKHTQLERMAAEKAAQQLTMEREVATAREYAERNHRSAHPVLHIVPGSTLPVVHRVLKCHMQHT